MAVRKSISTNAAVVSCDVCGRTLLRGETADVFLHGGARRMVCELCTGRAVHEGWIREGLDDVLTRGRAERRGSRSLLNRLRPRREEAPRPGADQEWDGAEPSPEPVAEAVVDPVVAQPEPEPSLYEHRSVRGVPTNADLKVARALEVFNGGRYVRTVAGVSRSLGAPVVSARPSATEGSVVTIVVAWELSWYRYEVDLADEASGPRVVGQGSELAELETPEQTPNAAADEAGRLHLAAPLT